MRISGVLVRAPLGIGSAGIRILSPLDASHVIAALPARWWRAARQSPGWRSGGCQRGFHLPSSRSLVACFSGDPGSDRSPGRPTGRGPRSAAALASSAPPLPLLMMIDLGLASAPTLLARPICRTVCSSRPPSQVWLPLDWASLQLNG